MHGEVVITLADGAMVTQSENGGGASYQVGPLDEAVRTIVLTKCVDPDTAN